MDLRDINAVGFASFGQLLDKKADFRILRTEGILKSFDEDSLEKIFQLPYGLDINPGKEYLSFVKISAQAGKYGPNENYILITQYKYAGVDVNKRKNYYGGCLAYKYEGYVISSRDALNFISMVLDLSKALIVDNNDLPLGIENFKGVKFNISFNGLSTRNHIVIPSPDISDEINAGFIDYNYVYSSELASVHRFILASGTSKIQGINSFEIRGIEDTFQKVVAEKLPVVSEKEIKFSAQDETENNKIMLENKDDIKIDELFNAKLKPISEKLDSLELKIAEMPLTKNGSNFTKNADKIFIGLIIILLALFYFILTQVTSITISTKPSPQQIDAKTILAIEKRVANRIDSLNRARMDSSVIYVAGKNDNLSSVADKFKVSPEKIINKNSMFKTGDTLIIRKF